jgi:SAM-dependent methyltransferase
MFWNRRKETAPAAAQISVPVDLHAIESDVHHAYRLILGREPDPEGLRHYVGRVRDGLPLTELIGSLLNSEEYRERAATQALERPDATPAATARLTETEDVAPTLRTTGITPSDLIQRYTVEQLIETAEEYYRRVPDATPLMSKPWSFLHETPEMLENLGRLLDGLQLGKTMSVLDFGAGTCWLSRCLAQLNCRTICCDASKTALQIGQQLFADYPLIGQTVYPPTFLVFDGHHIDLEDESVDRIICFDAFHHIPNQAEVLAEFGRVLKTGGIAGFSEPGPFQYEMQHHRVLENDIELSHILDLGKAAGFSDMSVSALVDFEMNTAQYSALVADAGDDALRRSVYDSVRETVTRRSVFFLYKGAVRHDSRRHVGLRHEIRVSQTEYVLAPGEDVVLGLTITNTGDARWLNENTEIFGVVRVGVHLYDASGILLDLDHSRHTLPVPVEPGGELPLTLTVPVPFDGPCQLKVDLVAEGVTWFENVGSSPVTVTVRRRQ